MGTPRRWLITGCASGIGHALAETALLAGHRVVATDVDLDRLHRLGANHRWPPQRSEVMRLDVRVAEDWRAALQRAEERFGGVDVLVNVAGVLHPSWVEDMDPREIDLHFDVNTKGAALGCVCAVPSMLARGSGHIINVAPLAALAPIPGMSLYSASKYALRSFSLALAREIGARGVKVTVVCPDAVRTPMLQRQENRDEAALTFSGPRVLEPSEVVDAIMGPVLRRAPLELFLPRSRGWLARVADVVPSAAELAYPWLRRRGRARQQRGH